MHHPKESREAGTSFSVRALAPPDSWAAAATACSTKAKGSLPAATSSALGQWEPSTFKSPDSTRMKTVLPPSLRPDLQWDAQSDWGAIVIRGRWGCDSRPTMKGGEVTSSLGNAQVLLPWLWVNLQQLGSRDAEIASLPGSEPGGLQLTII